MSYEDREAARAARRAEREAMTPYDHGQKLVERLSRVTGVKWTFGYIGNCGPGYDDRAWFAFREHPGRVGTRDDRIGGVPTENIEDLVLMLRGALAFALVEKANS